MNTIVIWLGWAVLVLIECPRPPNVGSDRARRTTPTSGRHPRSSEPGAGIWTLAAHAHVVDPPLLKTPRGWLTVPPDATHPRGQQSQKDEPDEADLRLVPRSVPVRSVLAVRARPRVSGVQSPRGARVVAEFRRMFRAESTRRRPEQPPPHRLVLTGKKGSNGRVLVVRCLCMAQYPGASARYYNYDPLGDADSIEAALTLYRSHVGAERPELPTADE